MQSSRPSGETIKLSFRLLLATLVLMFGLGVVGGFVGQYVNKSNVISRTTTSDNQEKFVTTIQQVTVSPSKNAAKIIETIDRSLVLIFNDKSATPISNGIVLTNDGLLVTVGNASGDSFFGIDQTGNKLPLEKVGADTLYGLTYFRLKNAVTVPVDINPNEASIGAILLSINRSPQTLVPQANTFLVGSYEFSGRDTAPAIQRFIKNGNQYQDTTKENDSGALAGSPILTDEGKVAGVLLGNSNKTALRISDVSESLDRLIAQKREYNPFAVIGLTPRYSFIENTTTGKKEFAVIVDAVANNSPSAVASIKAQDIITKINNTPIDWKENFSKQISISLPIQLTVIHQGQERTVSLSSQP